MNRKVNQIFEQNLLHLMHTKYDEPKRKRIKKKFSKKKIFFRVISFIVFIYFYNFLRKLI